MGFKSPLPFFRLPILNYFVYWYILLLGLKPDVHIVHLVIAAFVQLLKW